MTTSNPSSFPRALIIRANGHIEVVANTGLACLQEAVGGYIEAVHLGRVAVMYVNEEGLLIGEEGLLIGEEALLMGQVSGAGCRPHQ